MKRNHKIFSFIKKLTLKKRIVIIFAMGTLIPFICTAFISYNAMTSILNSKVEAGVKNNLKSVTQSLENTISNINHVSQQLAIPGSVGVKLDSYFYSEEPYQRAKLYQDIKTEINEITFTNPGIGLTMYYLADENKYLFNTYGVKGDFSVKELPMLIDNYKITNYGPHISNQPYNDKYVLSVWRKVDLSSENEVYVYIESSLDLTKNILQGNHTDQQSYLILDNKGKISYSEMNSLFIEKTYFNEGDLNSDSGLLSDYYWFKETSDQGWSVVSLIPISEYNKEKNQWIVQMIYLSIFFGIVSLTIAWLLWKMVYRPLQKFDKEIDGMLKSDFKYNTSWTFIPEFDHLLRQFHKMKNQISELFKVVEQKEKRRADLEVEKLLYQINPHFLMNTLDTANWLAVMNNQKDISQLVSSLNRLLYYNLGKAGQSSTIFEELDTLKEYLEIQKFRYDFEFDVRVQTEDSYLHMPVPRFILQPLVENAIYHGLSDDGYIYIEVTRIEDRIRIGVHDNGDGIKETDIHRILNQNQIKQQKAGMGIGINYVKRMLESYYEGEAELEINSIVGEGTSIVLTLPVLEMKMDD